MYCKYCGREIPEGTDVCPVCGPGNRKKAVLEEEPLSPSEYFADHGSLEAKKRIWTLWKIVILASCIPIAVVVIFVAAVRVRHPEAEVVSGIWLSPLTMSLPSLLLGAMACLKKTQGWAVAYLVVTLFMGPFCLPGPILFLLMMGPLTREYQAYVRSLGRGA